MARLAEARRRAEVELAAVRDAGPSLGVVAPDGGAQPPMLAAAADRGTPRAVRAEVERVAARLAQDNLPAAVEQVHALFRARSEAAGPALELVALAAQSRVRKGALAKVEPVLPRMRELPSSEPAVRMALARVLATVAVATGRAGQPERSLQRARAALALDKSTPEAYLALRRYQFQDDDLPGALDAWEHGLRLNPGDSGARDASGAGRQEAERLGVLQRISSEHFIVTFDGRQTCPPHRRASR